MKYKAVRCIGLLIFLFSCQKYAFCSQTYEAVKEDVEKTRSELLLRYESDLTREKNESLLAEMGLELQTLVLEKLTPYWYGTEWAFSGTSQKPGQGKIACGYFVTTLLRDAGIKLDRVKLAQQASENIIKSLVSRASIRRYSNKPITAFLNNIKEWGNGLYVVGLDYHVGFISVEPDGIYFIHSSYQSPYMVIREPASTSKILAASKYRVMGKLTDEKLISGWLTQAHFKTIGS